MPKKLSNNGARLGTKVSAGLREQTAALIDTGCGIGNLRAAVEAITDKPVVVINTHTHPDYLGSNSQFDKIAMLERPLSHRVSENGISHQILEKGDPSREFASHRPRDMGQNLRRRLTR